MSSREMDEMFGTSAAACSTETVVCACFRVTEDTVVEAIAAWNLTSVKDVCRMTNAGAGCMACRLRLKKYVEQARTSACPMS